MAPFRKTDLFRTRIRFARRQNGPESLFRFLKDCQGSTAIMMTLMLPVMILGMGIGAETGFQYMTQRKLQHSADLAAHAGAARLRAGDTLTEIVAAATHVAEHGGFQAATGTITVHAPPVAGPAAGDTQSVEVILNHVQRRYFSLLVSQDPVPIRARAVARIADAGAAACVLALSPTASGAITVSGSTSVGLNGCDIISNSNAADSLLMTNNSAALTADCAQTVGRAVVSSQLQLTGCQEVREFAPVARDPYRSVAEPAVVGACRNSSQGHPVRETILTPSDNHPSGVNSMRFCSGLDLKGTVQFGPGLYIIEGGDFTMNGGNLEMSGILGAGVTFYLTGTGRLRLAGNALLTLEAPTTGPYAGLLFFGGRSQSGVTHRVNGASGSTLQGAVYAPASTLELTGNSRATGGCTQIIGWRVTFTGNSTLKSDCSSAGTRDVLANEAISLVE